MTIRSEIRAALVSGPKSTDELLPSVPSCEGDRKRLGMHMSNLAGEQMVRRAGLSDDGKPLYQINPAQWPAKASDDPDDAPPQQASAKPLKPASQAAPTTPKPPRKAKASKAKEPPRPSAKAARKTAPARPPKPATTRALAAIGTPDWRVGLQLDGSVFAFDVRAGTHQVIDAPIVRQILGMAALLRPAA